MANLNITLAVDTASKTCTQAGVPSIRESVNFVLTGLSGTSASNLRLWIILNGQLMANCDSFAVGSGGYVGLTDLNTTELIGVFGQKRSPVSKNFRIVVQDLIQDITFLNDEIEILDHPYQDGMADPTPVDPIGGVEYAPLAGYNEHVNDADIHFTAVERVKLAGVETGATADQTAAEIRDALETLTTTSRLNLDSVKEGSTNLILTSAERSKLAAIEAGAEVNPDAAEVKSLYESNSDTNAYTDAEKSKLAGVEAGATADMTGGEIKSALQALGAGSRLGSDYIDQGATNLLMTATERNKLLGIESGAEVNPNAAEIKALYEVNADTNAYTDAEKAKLGGIEAGATTDQTAGEIKTALETLSGSNRLSADYIKDGSTNVAMTATERSKLSAIEAGAEVNPDASEVKTLYESNSNTNAFTDAYKAAVDALPSFTPTPVLLTDNSDNYIVLGASATYRAFFIDYTQDDTINFLSGSLCVFHDGTTATVVMQGFGAYPADITGITFDADISGANVRLKITLASAGSDIRMVYHIRSKITVYP